MVHMCGVSYVVQNHKVDHRLFCTWYCQVGMLFVCDTNFRIFPIMNPSKESLLIALVSTSPLCVMWLRKEGRRKPLAWCILRIFVFEAWIPGLVLPGWKLCWWYYKLAMYRSSLLLEHPGRVWEIVCVKQCSVGFISSSWDEQLSRKILYLDLPSLAKFVYKFTTPT